MILGGTGGGNTITGMHFEKSTDLSKFLQTNFIVSQYISPNYKPSQLKQSYYVYDAITEELVGILTRKSQFYKVLDDMYPMLNNIECKWQPDEAFYNIKQKTWYIVEKKFQHTSGSADEKLLTFPLKREQYQQIFKTLHIKNQPHVEFIAMLNEKWWGNPDNYPRYENDFNIIKSKGIIIIFDVYTNELFGLHPQSEQEILENASLIKPNWDDVQQ